MIIVIIRRQLYVIETSADNQMLQHVKGDKRHFLITGPPGTT